MTTAVKTKLYVISYEDGEGASQIITEDEVLRRVNEEREQYIADCVDEEYIKEVFPTEIKDINGARMWITDMGCTLISVPEELSESQRILKRMYDLNGQITGRIKRKEKDYFDQGYWNFTIKVLDLDSDCNIARLQIKADKMCPSGLWDNGISVVSRPSVTLYDFSSDIDNTVRKLINRYFRSDRGTCGRDYKIERFSV